MSFAQLDSRASVIARTLVKVSAQPTGMVAVLFESKATAIQAMFGAARSGRGYIPLDPADPDERLTYILRDCEPAALLTEAALADRARSLALPGCEIIDVNELPAGAESTPLPDVEGDAIAWILYTSGSTGHPKGVTQSHRNQLFFADAYAKTMRISPGDRLSFLYSVTFSAATMDVFGGLLNGATLCAYDLRRDGFAALGDWLDRERIAVLHAVPTVYRELMRSLDAARRLTHLRGIDLGGEAVFGSDVELLRQHTSTGCVLVNHLAATEASVIAQHVVTGRETWPSGEILPVGVSPEGLHVEIRREDGTTADADEVGEIVVASVHVSPGYWRRPELNAAAFAEETGAPGWRRYATGDRGRIDGHGRLHFIGRHGSRVKVRGHSVDLLEVEAALASCAGVAKAAVVAASGGHQSSSPELLTAYLVVPSEAHRDPIRIRTQLAARLPSYMLPAEMVFLDSFPLTSSGKIDRSALATSQPRPRRGAGELDDPRDDLEHAIAAIMQRLLNATAIRRSDDFFLLGGDSLSAIEFEFRLRDTFGTSPAKLADDATVAGIADAIRRRRASGAATTHRLPILVPVRETGSAPPLFLVHGRYGQAFVGRGLLDRLGADQPVWSVRARGLDGKVRPHSTIEAMAADYVAAIRRRSPRGPYFIGALCVGAYIATVMARSLQHAGEQVLPLLLFDPPGWPPPRLTEGPAVSREHVAEKLTRHHAAGKIDVPVDDPQYTKATTRTVRALERAIDRHTPEPYDAPVVMLSSRDRMPVSFATLFPLLLQRFEVASSHAGVIDTANPVFARALDCCMELVRAAAADRLRA